MTSLSIEELEQQVITNIDFIDEQLNEQHSPDGQDIEGIVDYGMQLAAIISLCGKTLAEAKQLLNRKELIYMQSNKDLWDKPTVLKKLLEGNLAEYYSMVVHADRMSAAITHKMDFYRSVLSKHKEELRMQMQFNAQKQN